MLLAVPGDGLRREGSGSGDAARGHRRKSPPPGCLQAANVSWRRRAIWPVSRPGWRGRSAWTRPARDGRASGTRPARPCWWISRPRTWPGHGSMMCLSTGNACRSPPWRCVSAISMACSSGGAAGTGRSWTLLRGRAWNPSCPRSVSWPRQDTGNNDGGDRERLARTGPLSGGACDDQVTCTVSGHDRGNARRSPPSALGCG
jgi:hypothetical protein